MELQDFEVHFGRMVETWGQKAYPRPRVSQIWESVKGMTSWEFSKIVDALIGSSKFAPLLVDIEAASKQVKNKNQHQRRDRFLEQNQDKSCPWCFGEGFVICQRRDDLTDFVFRCNCDFASFFDYKFEPWQISLESIYEPEYERRQGVQLKLEDIKREGEGQSTVSRIARSSLKTLPTSPAG